MKKKIKNGLLLALLFITAFSNQSNAQNLNKDAVAFTKNLQDNYNKGDLPALMTMYADNVSMVQPDGTLKTVPKSFYEEDYVRDFGEAAGTYMVFKVVNTEKLADGKIKIKGSFDGYDFDRKSNTKLGPDNGTFEDVIVNDGGKWKFSQIKNVFAMTQVVKDVRALTQKFQDAYSEENADALKAMFTVNAERIMADGKMAKGAANIADDYREFFKNDHVSSIIKLADVKPQFDGSIITTGTYNIYGTSVKGARVALKGSYSNKLVKENGQLKIEQIKLGGLVKTIATIKVADFAKWKAGFDAYRRISLDAGQLTAETGTLMDDPNTAYVISEWATAEKAKAFFATPELAAHMKKEGVQGAPQIMFLDEK